MFDLRQMTLTAFLTAFAAMYPSIASAATPSSGRYHCVLMGQGACSDESICFGNRISPNDRNIKLIVDFGGGTASLNGIPGRIVNEGGMAVIRWHLSAIAYERVDMYSLASGPIIELGPANGGGATAAFRCQKRA